jgi:hypothetical protein
LARPVDVVELKYLERPFNWESSTCASPAMIWNKTLHLIKIWNIFIHYDSHFEHICCQIYFHLQLVWSFTGASELKPNPLQ